MHLLTTIERYLRKTGMRPTRFGREAVRDPRFVFDLRNGREAGRDIHDRVRTYITARPAPARPAPTRRTGRGAR